MRADRRRWSLRWRVTAGATAVLVVALAMAALAAAGLLRRSLEADEETVLSDRVDEVELLIGNGLLPAVLEPTGRDVGQVQVVDAAGRVVSVTPGLAGTTRIDVVDAPAIGEESSATVDGDRIDGVPGEQYRVIARTVGSPAGPLTIYAVTSLDAAQRAERILRNGLLLGLPLLVLLAGAVIYQVVGRALAPVEAMRAEVDRIEAVDLSGRVDVAESDDELSRLGETLNRMLERLEEDSRRQRLFGAAASHELRSPLSAIRTDLEVGLTYPERADWPQVASDVLIEVARLESLAHDLRVLTRVRPVSERQDVDLADLLAAEVQRRVPPAGISYVLHPHPAVVRADTDGVVQVVRNLLDNAERHARSRIDVSVTTEGTDAVVTVANDGDAIPPEELDRIFEPFHRLDEARSLDEGGSGLGLAIARSIMSSAGGTLRAEALPSGASFSARFPEGTSGR